ncbi:hypothetical protein [Pedobacter aquatilis]|uniref:hypothetical protein n=1 Tax=Pedobacter aquatilis TaxID=351343 RepID=UPI00292FD8D6|nr:hypothetical protein [Pedobacter aquatilis]
MSERKRANQEIDYMDSNWLEEIISKTLPQKSTLPFSILSKPIAEIRSHYVLPNELSTELYGFTHLIAVYMCERAYKRERLLYYHTDPTYRAMNTNDYACRLLCKMKILSLPDKFNMEAEQALGLTAGLINRLQSKNYYDVKSINERKFFKLHVKFGQYEERDLIDIMILKPLIKK